MKIGIFGGAFNPPHNGHLHLMRYYLKALSLDKILLIPTADPPHKTSVGLAPAADRLRMLELIAEKEPQLEISDIEFRREGKSYTCETLLQLRELYPEDVFYLLIGSDQYLAFHQWYRTDVILSLATVCTMARDEGEYAALLQYREEHAEMKDSIISAEPPLPLSSTEIRERVKSGKGIRRLVPKAVADYIKERGLYV